MINNLYNCAQPELYLICRKGWHLCTDNLAAFTAYKPKYSEAFIAQNLSDINDADNMDDSKARYARSQNLRLDLVEKKEEVLDIYHLLKGYIEDAYRTDKVPTMIQAAGQQFYAKASSNNWAHASALLSAMGPFVSNNLATLTDNNNMPPNFSTRIQTVKEEFEQMYKNWSASDNAAATETDAKITANNAIYNNLKTMLSDAQKVFRKDALLAEKFTLLDLMSQVRGPRPSGISGRVLNSVNQKAIENAQISIPALDKVIKTDVNGQFQLMPLPVGKYTVIIEADSFDTVTLEKYEIKSSVVNRLIQKMEAVEVLETAPVAVLV